VIERLTRDNVEMADRLGFVMGQLEEARVKIALLEASPPAPTDAVAAGTTITLPRSRTVAIRAYRRRDRRPIGPDGADCGTP
jgi:hypothetical protein